MRSAGSAGFAVLLPVAAARAARSRSKRGSVGLGMIVPVTGWWAHSRVCGADIVT